MAPHSSTLAWKIPWTEEPGRLQSMGSLRVGQDWATSLSLFTFMEKEMATHSSVLAWRIPGMGEPHGLPSMGSHRVKHDWSDLAAAAACMWVCVPETVSLTSTQILISKCHPHSQEPRVFGGMAGAWRVKMNPKNLVGYRKRYSKNDESKKGNGLNCFVQKESLLIHQFEDISLVAQWLRLYSQCRGPGSNPTSGNQIPPPWCNWRSLVPQLRPRANK